MSDEADNKTLTNLSGLSKPMELLIEKMASAAGILYEPTRIQKKAIAEAMSNELKAVSDIRITDIRRRAANRFVEEQTLMQGNMESVTTKALPDINEDARPNDIEDDWIMNFFDRVRLVSDEQMQTLWAKLLAGEANTPGSYSKRTINLLSSLDKSDAEEFSNLLRFTWFVCDFAPIIYSLEHEIYKTNKITFGSLTHLNSIGLINLASVGGYNRRGLPKNIRTCYHAGTILDIEFPSELNSLEVGSVLLTQSGMDIGKLCSGEPIPGFIDYVLGVWESRGLIASCAYPKTSD